MTHVHEPDPTFLEKLEWQLKAEERRRRRFRPPEPSSTQWRNIKMIGIVFCSILTGMMASSTVAHFQEISQRQLLLARQETQIRLVESRLELMREHQAELARKIEAGLMPVVEQESLAGQIARLEIERHRRQLDYEEILLSSRAPRDDLAAPRVDERDFVTERLALEMQSLDRVEAQVQAEEAYLRQRVDLGLIHPQELAPYELQLERLAGARVELQRKLELRNRYLGGELSAEQVELQEMLTAAERRLATARSVAAHLRQTLSELEKVHRLGLVDKAQLRQARLQLQDAEAEEWLAQLEIQSLHQNLPQ